MNRGLHYVLGMGLAVAISGCSVANPLIVPDAHASYAAGLGDLDGDGDLDALLANGGGQRAHLDTIWINQGGSQDGMAGRFEPEGAMPGRQNSRSLAFGDLDGDGDLDALAGVMDGLQVWINQGGQQGGRTGRFELQPEVYSAEGTAGEWRVGLGDLDGDGDLDAFVGVCCGGRWVSDLYRTWLPPRKLVLINDGAGGFADSLLRLGTDGTLGFDLGDLDGDGDLDVFTANAAVNPDGDGAQNQPDRVWLNDGTGEFRDSDQRLGSSNSTDVALGDLDGDGDLDAFVASRGPASVWLNDGAARFTDSGQGLGERGADEVFLADLDGDGDLDALVRSSERADIWLNDSQAAFTLSGQRLAISGRHAVALGDLDGDGDLDLFAAQLDKDYKVWWNDGFGRLGTRWR